MNTDKEIIAKRVADTKYNINVVLDDMVDQACMDALLPTTLAIGCALISATGLVWAPVSFVNNSFVIGSLITAAGSYSSVVFKDNLKLSRNSFKAVKYLKDKKEGFSTIVDQLVDQGVDVNSNNVYINKDEDGAVKLVVDGMPEYIFNEKVMEEVNWDDVSKNIVDRLNDVGVLLKENKNDTEEKIEQNTRQSELIDYIKEVNKDRQDISSKDEVDNNQNLDNKDNSDHDHNDKSDNDMER